MASYSVGDIVKLTMKDENDEYDGEIDDYGNQNEEWYYDRIEPRLMGAVVEIIGVDVGDLHCVGGLPYAIRTIDEDGEEMDEWVRATQILRKF